MILQVTNLHCRLDLTPVTFMGTLVFFISKNTNKNRAISTLFNTFAVQNSFLP